jgi:hypothetical protein
LGAPFETNLEGSLNLKKFSLSCLRTSVEGCFVSWSCFRSLANNCKASSDSNEDIKVLISLVILLSDSSLD